MQRPDISIIVCTFNRSRPLKNALRDLTGQNVEEQAFTYEIVVVNDASTDDTAEVIEEIAQAAPVPVRQVTSDGSGVARARNVGLAEARGDWVAFFDDDQRTHSNWLSALWSTASRGRADLVGGPIVPVLPSGVTVGPVCRAVFGEHPTHRQRQRRVMPLPAGGNRLIRRTVFDLIGSHDESTLAEGGEDLEFASRAQARGCTFGWSPDAVVWHEIPEARLAPERMKPYCEQAGAAKAYTELKRWGRVGLLVRSAVLSAKSVVNAGLYLGARATGSRTLELDTRARYWVAKGYSRQALTLLLPSLFDSTQPAFRHLHR